MVQVIPAQSEKRMTALSILFGHLTDQERESRIAEVLDEAENGRLNLDGLLLAEEKEEPVGAGLLIAPEDGPVFIWPPASCKESSARETVDALLQEMARLIDLSEAWLGQCMLEPQQFRERDALNRNGFNHLTNLVFLQRTLNHPLESPLDICFETIEFQPGKNDQRFAEVLERTYTGTLDCAELNGTRTGRDALTAHKTAGEFDAARWKIYRFEEVDVGVLLFSEHPEQNAWEVVYMGIVPNARGNGYGKEVLLRGLHEAKIAGREKVLLAVDVRNTFAINTYKNLGFVESGVRAVHVRMRRTTRSSE